MVTDISFGNLGKVGDKNVLSGTASGIDTETLIAALTETRRLPAVQLETELALNNSKISAYSEFESLTKAFQTSLDVLRNPSGTNGSSTNVFNARTAFLSTSDGTTASNFVGVVAENGASIGKYEIEVNQLATGDVFQSAAFTARDTDVVDAGLLNAGTFTLNDESITVDADDTLNDIVIKINAVTGSTNVEAAVLQISDSDFRLVLTHSDTGEDADITIDDSADSVFANIAVSEIQNAVNSNMTYIVGATETVVSRATNTITDFIDNVTISLFQETTVDESVTLEIDQDSSEVGAAVVGFIDSYNNLKVFYAQQNERDDNGVLTDTAFLNDSSLLDSTMNSIINKLTTTVDSPLSQSITTNSGAPARLGDLGITFGDFAGDSENGIPTTTSILEIDADKFASKLEAYFDDVQALFEFSFVSNNADFAIFDRGDISSTEDLTISIDNDTNAATVTHIDGHELAVPLALTYDTTDDEVALSNLTAVLKGVDGTALEGVELFYTQSSTAESVSFATEVNDGEKAYSIDVDDTNETAQVTAIHGLTLAAAIDLTYEKSDTGNSALILGVDDSIFENLEFLYVGKTTESINFSFAQGIADKLFNSVEEIATENGTSLIDSEIESLQSSNDNLEDSISSIDLQVEVYRDRLLDQFSALEAAIAASESILQLLDAQNESRNN